MGAARKDYLVTICDACLRASCWHGIFFCDAAAAAGTRDIPAKELRKLYAEHPSYYTRMALMRVCGTVTECT